MRQLEPGTGERVRELLRVVQEPLGDRPVNRIDAQRQIRGEHRRSVPLRGIVGIGHGVRRRLVLRRPLVCAGRALGKFPLVLEQVFQEVVVPLHRVGGPCAFQPAGDRIAADAAAIAVLPAEALLLDAGAFGIGADILGRVGGAVGLAEGVAAGDQRHRLFVIHRHAREGLANVVGGRDRIGIAVRPFRIDVDQAHLHRRERIFEVAVAGVTLVIEPCFLIAPVDVFFRFPDVLAPAAEAEGLEAHRFQRDVAGQNHQVGPGDFLAVFLLDGPQKTPRLVEADIVRPAIQRREPLRAGTGAAAAVADAIGAGAVPGHADEEGTVVAIVRRPPGLAVGHQGMQVLDDGIQVEALEFLGIVEPAAHRIGGGRILVEDPEVELVRPPVAVRQGTDCRVGLRSAHHRALAIVRHVLSDRGPLFPRFRAAGSSCTGNRDPASARRTGAPDMAQA